MRERVSKWVQCVYKIHKPWHKQILISLFSRCARETVNKGVQDNQILPSCHIVRQSEPGSAMCNSCTRYLCKPDAYLWFIVSFFHWTTLFLPFFPAYGYNFQITSKTKFSRTSAVQESNFCSFITYNIYKDISKFISKIRSICQWASCVWEKQTKLVFFCHSHI